MNSKAKTILIIIAVTVVALAAAITAIALCTDISKRIRNFFDTDFRVMYGMDKYVGSDNTITLPNSGEVELKVKGCSDFTYKITANADIVYTVDGISYSLDSTDVGSILMSEARVKNGSIYFDCDKNNSLKGVLSRLHDSINISFPENPEYPFMLTVISGNDEIKIAFVFKPSEVKDITINPDSVAF